MDELGVAAFGREALAGAAGRGAGWFAGFPAGAALRVDGDWSAAAGWGNGADWYADVPLTGLSWDDVPCEGRNQPAGGATPGQSSLLSGSGISASLSCAPEMRLLNTLVR
jgi:hypothetical protein